MQICRNEREAGCIQGENHMIKLIVPDSFRQCCELYCLKSRSYASTKKVFLPMSYTLNSVSMHLPQGNKKTPTFVWAMACTKLGLCCSCPEMKKHLHQQRINEFSWTHWNTEFAKQTNRPEIWKGDSGEIQDVKTEAKATGSHRLEKSLHQRTTVKPHPIWGEGSLPAPASLLLSCVI